MGTESLVVRVGSDLTGFNAGMKMAVGTVGKYAKRMALAFTAATTAAALIGSKFSGAMMTTATVAQAFGKDLEALEDKARQLGRTTAFTATQAAMGMYSLASAGMKTNEILAATEHAMKLAGATGTQMGQATNVIAASIKQFGMEASESGRIANTYAGAITNSLLTMDKLTQAMKYAGTAGSALGWSIEETTAAVAQFANLGLEGSMSGTQLRMSMIQLSKQTPKATKAIAEMGLSFEDVNPESHSFGEILQTIGERAISTQQAVSMFGSRSGLNIKKLSEAAVKGESDFDGFVQMLKEAQEGVGRATEMYDRMMNTFGGAWKVMLSSLQDLSIEYFQQFKGQGAAAFKAITEEVKNLTGWISDNKGMFMDFFDALLGIAGFMGGLVVDTAKIMSSSAIGIKNWWDNFTGLLSAMAEGTTQFKLWDDQVKIFDDHMKQATESLNKLIDEPDWEKVAPPSVSDSLEKIKDNARTALLSASEDVDTLASSWQNATSDVEDHGYAVNAVAKNSYAEHIEMIAMAMQDEKKLKEESLKHYITWNNKLIASEEKKYEKMWKFFEDGEKRSEGIHSDFYKKTKFQSKGYHDWYLAQLGDQYLEYDKYVQDKDALNKWYDGEVESFQQAEFDANKKLQEDKLLETGTFFDGLKLGFEEVQGSATTWAEHGKTAAETFAADAKTGVADFINPFKQDFLDVEKLWDSMLDSMVGSLTDAVADMAVQWGLAAGKKIVSELGSKASEYVIEQVGDYIFAGSPAYKAGAWKIEKDQGAFLHKGEMVLDSNIADYFRAASERGDSTGAPTGGTEKMTQSQKDSLANVAYGLFGNVISGQVLGFQTDYAKMFPSGIIGFGKSETKKELGINTPIGKYSQGALGLLATLATIAGYTIPGGPVAMAALGIGASYLGESLFGEEYGGFEGLGIGNPASYGGLGYGMKGWGGYKGLGIGNPAAYGRQYGGGGYFGQNYSGGHGFISGDPIGGWSSDVDYGTEGQGGMSGWGKRGGWLHGPESGHRPTLHGSELVLNEDQVKAIREVNAGGGGDNYYFINQGVITTDDVDEWFADRQYKNRQNKVGEEEVSIINPQEAGIDFT